MRDAKIIEELLAVADFGNGETRSQGSRGRRVVLLLQNLAGLVPTKPGGGTKMAAARSRYLRTEELKGSRDSDGEEGGDVKGTGTWAGRAGVISRVVAPDLVGRIERMAVLSVRV